MKETWKHKVIREGLEKGWSFMRISKEHKLSVSAITKILINLNM